MHVAIAGGSGFVGKALQEELLAGGHQVSILTRNPAKAETAEGVRAVGWLTEGSRPAEELGHVDALVNLAGESINGLRWTAKKKERILQSRLSATDAVMTLIKELASKPSVLVNASAVGYYGMSQKETFTEEDESQAGDFLASVVKRWEAEAARAEELGVRTVYARFGIVLGRKEGSLPLMALPYKLMAGGRIGSGKQWLSWVHVKDVAGMIRFAIEKADISGPFNVTSPHPVKMKEFGKTLAKALHRPDWLPVPGFVIKLALGEMSALLLGGQRVIPGKALDHPYSYRFPLLLGALRDIFAPK